ncbi:unnamed protein product [Lupinus luteus]|uniref:Uncharacterized protein n=1 Tax=Lupinus luteus TaxID=3873 RepID=A0AAV1YLQ9_LUPLU
MSTGSKEKLEPSQMEASRYSKQAEEELTKVNLNQGEEEVVEEFKTPTRSRNKIPSIQTFPPAPRKKRTFSLLMKRSSESDLSLFVRDEEESRSCCNAFPSLGTKTTHPRAAS